jgi:hypothetical protein
MGRFCLLVLISDVVFGGGGNGGEKVDTDRLVFSFLNFAPQYETSKASKSTCGETHVVS